VAAVFREILQYGADQTAFHLYGSTVGRRGKRAGEIGNQIRNLLRLDEAQQEGRRAVNAGGARGPRGSRQRHGALARKGIREAKNGNTLVPITMTLFYATDFADRLENEIIPALRAGFVVLIDRYIFSIKARAIARNQDRRWIEQVAGVAPVPHAVYCLRAEVHELVRRLVLGRGAFDCWEIWMAKRYHFTVVDACRPADLIFRDLRHHIATLQSGGLRGDASHPAVRRKAARSG
jgi:hypothetical protein